MDMARHGSTLLKKYKVYQVDAFTKTPFKGNPAGVVVNADGLDDAQMQMIARELNNSETSFLFSPADNSCDGQIRYFTPTTEVPTCGHATIGAMYAKAVDENLDSCVLKIKTCIGVLPFGITKVKNDYKVTMVQGAFELSPPLRTDAVAVLLDALGLNQGDLDERCPIQIASTGHSKVMVGIQSGDKLNSIDPNLSMLADLSKQIQCNGYFVFTFDTDDDCLTTGRMFAPGIGIAEDPVTGNANGPLGGYLIQNKIIDPSGGEFTFKGKQGEKIGRKGIVEVKVQVEGDQPTQIQIMGDAVIIFKTMIAL